MQTDFQMIIARLKDQGFPIRPQIRGMGTKNTQLNQFQLVSGLPVSANPETMYGIKCSDLPPSPPESERFILLCLEDTAPPPWLTLSSYPVIFTSTEDVFSKVSQIIDELREARLRFSSAVNDILEALYYGQGLEAICDIGSELFGNPLCMLDTGLKSLAVPRSYPTRTAILRQAMERGYSDNRDIRFLKAQGWFDPKFYNRTAAYFPRETFAEYAAWDSVYGCCVGYVRANGIVIAYMLLCGENTPILDYQQAWMTKLTQITSIELQKGQLAASQKGSMYEAFLTDLIEGQIVDSDIIKRRSQLLGRTLQPFHHVVTIQKDTVFGQTTFSDAEQRRLRAWFPGSMSAVYQGSVVLLTSSTDQTIPLLEDWETLRHDLSTSGLSAGISSLFTELSELSQYYNQSVTALKFGRGLHSGEHMFRYPDYAVFHAIELCAKNVELQSLCHPGLLRLYKSKLPGDRELYHTLYLYLLYMRDINKICDTLHIHRSTLFYRLNKIKSTLEVDLEQGNDILHLMFTCKLIEYIDHFYPSSQE